MGQRRGWGAVRKTERSRVKKEAEMGDKEGGVGRQSWSRSRSCVKTRKSGVGYSNKLLEKVLRIIIRKLSEIRENRGNMRNVCT